jgi:hypothetical protein
MTRLSEGGFRLPYLAGVADRMICWASETLPSLGPVRAETMKTYLSKPSSNLPS